MPLRPVIGLVASLASVAAAQPGLQSPLPTGRNIGGAAFTSPAHAFAVADDLTLIETSDGGATWATRMSSGFSSDPFYTITAASPTHLYLAGNNQDAFRSTDGGRTWTRMSSMLAGSVRRLQFITPTSGFAAYNGALTHTSDGGATWQLRSGYPGCPITFDAEFADENVGVIAGARSTPYNDGGVYYTSDGGLTWTLTLAGRGGPIARRDATTLLCAAGTDLLVSPDNGLTWFTQVWGMVPEGLSDLAIAGASQTLVGVSGVGDIWVSADLGSSWELKEPGMGVLPANWNVTFHDELHGLVGGANGLLYRTEDGGVSWALVNHGCSDEVYGLRMFDDERGMAVTHRGFVFRTLDHGLHWGVQRLRETGIVWGREEGLRAVEFIDHDTVVTAGAGGVLFRTEDFGETWWSQGWPNNGVFPSNFEIDAVKFTDENNGWVGGIYADINVYRTRDGGWTWEPQEGLGAAICAIDFKGARGWMCSQGGIIYRTVDSGDHWATVALPPSSSPTDLEFADADRGWIVGRNGLILRSTDGGASWTAITRPQTESYLDVRVVSPTEIWAVGNDANSQRYFTITTLDGGRTWTRTNHTGAEDWYSRLEVRPSGRVWAAGYAGRISHTPAPPLRIALTQETPRSFAPGVETVIPLRVIAGEEQVVPGSESMLLQRSPGGPYETVPLRAVGGDAYEAVVPGLRCGDAPRYYFTATGSGGTTVRLPAGAPGTTYSAPVGTFGTQRLLDVGFDAGLPAGWSATGLWHVSSSCGPAGSCGSAPRAYFGQDSNCTFNTGLRASGVLRSPTVTLPTLGAGENIVISFCSALDTEYPDNALGDDDQAQLWFVYSGGSNPINWFSDHRTARVQTFTINQHAGRTGWFEWRFDSMNTYMNAFRGWHVDNVVLTAPGLACVDPCPPDFNGDGFLDLFDYADYLACFEAGVCPPGRTADYNGDGFADFFDYSEFVAAFETGC